MGTPVGKQDGIIPFLYGVCSPCLGCFFLGIPASSHLQKHAWLISYPKLPFVVHVSVNGCLFFVTVSRSVRKIMNEQPQMIPSDLQSLFVCLVETDVDLSMYRLGCMFLPCCVSTFCFTGQVIFAQSTSFLNHLSPALIFLYHPSRGTS